MYQSAKMPEKLAIVALDTIRLVTIHEGDLVMDAEPLVDLAHCLRHHIGTGVCVKLIEGAKGTIELEQCLG
jgi:hypothetical protein